MALHSWTRKVQQLLRKEADPKLAAPMAKYMRSQFPYLGIKTPQRKELLKQLISEEGLPLSGEADRVVRELWDLPEREYQYAAIAVTERLSRRLPPEFIDTLQHLITSKSWWDTVDGLAKTVGQHFTRFPEVKAERLPQWRTSDNIWLRRSALLFQLSYKKETDFPLLCAIVRENLGSEEFFINKAIGWALRQYAREDPEAVRKFVESHKLSKLSRREAMKHLE